MLTAPVYCPVCKKSHSSLGTRLGGALPAIACPSLTPTGTVRAFPLDNLAVIGAGEGVDVPRPRELSIAEKQNELVRKQQEIDRAEAEIRVKKAAERIDRKHAALIAGDSKTLAKIEAEEKAEQRAATVEAP